LNYFENSLNRRRELAITVELSDFATFDHELLTIFQCQPSEQLRLMEAAAHDALKKSMLENQEGRTRRLFCRVLHLIFCSRSRFEFYSDIVKVTNTVGDRTPFAHRGTHREACESVWYHREYSAAPVKLFNSARG
jgi:hypothetical protein